MQDMESLHDRLDQMEVHITVLETAVRGLLRFADLQDELMIPRFMKEVHGDADALKGEAASTSNSILHDRKLQQVRLMRRLASLMVD